jgi:hypothetical protein
MMFVVEIESPKGERATKEYEGRSIMDVVHRVQEELSDYPGFILVHVTAQAAAWL